MFNAPFFFFHQSRGLLIGAFVDPLSRLALGPKYDGKYLHDTIRKILGSTRLHETLTSVVIPTFDIKKLQPVIFSSYRVIYQYVNFFLKKNHMIII